MGETNATLINDYWKFISDKDTTLFTLVFLVFGCGIVSIFGIIANIINITVLLKQGAYAEHGGINLLGLAIMDLIVVLNTLCIAILYGIVLMDPPHLSWVPFDVMHYTSTWPHLMLVQMQRAITAYIAFERCICVVFPFKVKAIFTPTRSIIVMVCIVIAFLLSYSPVFIKQQLKYAPDSVTNVTKLRMVYSADWLLVVDVMWAVNSILINQGSVIIVLVCTMITVYRVRLSKAWRNAMLNEGNSNSSDPTSGPSKQGNSTSKLQKEDRLIKMITFISFIFLVCYIPDLIFMLMYAINPGIRIGHKYDNLARVLYAIIFFMESISSTINICVYYRMSSRYKTIFRKLTGMDEKVGE